MAARDQPSSGPRDAVACPSKNNAESSSPKTSQVPSTTGKEGDDEARDLPLQPRFQSTKEKECWHLYRKMCDKGVYVSFDTVLRGMLTPTEYRLRQKDLLQD